MPTFYQRPLTWLLVAAFALFDALYMAGAFGGRSGFGVGGVVCQLFLVTDWVMFGRAHWLLRSATALLSIVAATLLIALAGGDGLSLSSWQRIVAAVALILVSTFAGMLIGMGLKTLMRKSSSDAKSKKWQISLIEMFGLTLIVACGSWLARGVAFERLLQHSDIAIWMGISCITGIALAAIGTRPVAMRGGGIVLIVLATLAGIPFNKRDIEDLFVAIALLGICLFIRSFEPAPTNREVMPDEATDDVIPAERLETLRAKREAEHLDERV